MHDSMRYHYHKAWPKPLTMSISSPLSLSLSPSLSNYRHVWWSCNKEEYPNKNKQELWLKFENQTPNMLNPNKPTSMAMMREQDRVHWDKKDLCIVCYFVYVLCMLERERERERGERGN